MNELQWSPIGPPQPVPPPLPPTRVDFTGDRTEFRKMATKGAALELVTFGFYRFWLVTDIRRHLWSNTSIDGDAAEYTGRGKELLIGFLFALAILVPIYLGYFLITIEAERWQGFASTPLFISFYAFGQFAIYRARCYRLTRTVWRGVRFWMDGSGWAYSLRAMLWGLLVFLTLGLALPWREASLERYKMRHTHYGDLTGDFEGDGWEFFKRGWWLWLLTPIALVIFPLAPFLYSEFKAREWRWWLAGLRIGGVSLSSDLPHDAFYGLYWKVIGWWLLLSTLFGFYLAAATALIVKLSGLPVEQALGPDGPAKNIPLLVTMVIGYFALALAVNIVMRVYLQRDLWVKVLETVEMHDIGAAADVRGSGELASALGEGFADSLDVAGF
ncbi:MULTISPECIES: YjgN family protein [unclassified Bradyrhizobium]|uniref:YjgN family protein n=1 Tax=unclassified Bradyrhizobium TaxID=2631580 RepID=UPI00247A600C|nr:MULTISPECIES: YjgN family protein [unclassified Bradyrhizobium]WGR75267.1 YjgN family protein [Bradyrhizobium sp. ISRA426]WGR82768.1 YjgN family protein [Bradyrhizobium sp. ISRA430]WGR90465.1 YjgN family protein [Bradyrhizobium sp. ISRA432]